MHARRENLTQFRDQLLLPVQRIAKTRPAWTAENLGEIAVWQQFQAKRCTTLEPVGPGLTTDT